MIQYPYVVVGCGMAAHAAVHAIRAIDPGGPVAVLGAEPTGPYRRPPLSKGLWRDEAPDSIWLGMRLPALEVLTGRRVVSIDRVAREVVDDRGDRHGYGRLLLATGGDPRRMAHARGRVVYFRTFQDWERLRALAVPGARIAVVGGGFIGSEITAALATNGVETMLLYPEETPCARVLPRDVGLHLGTEFREHGVRLLPRTTAASVEDGPGERTTLVTSGGERLVVDGVVAGLGIDPATALARACGLEVDDGILVDPSLRTSDPLVFAAGDVARFHNPGLGRSMRVEHEDAAVTMGAAAGRSMAGEPTRYDHLPSFYSDIFDLGYEAVGVTDARLEVVADWSAEYLRGFLYYLEQGRVRGVVCWGAQGHLEEARALVASPGPFRPRDLVRRIAA